MRGEKSRIEAVGARLAFVGNGNTRCANDFARRYVPDCEVYTDPSRYTYAAIGAREGIVSTLAGAANTLRAMRGGHFQTSIRGNAFQQGGVLVAVPGDRACYLYLSRVAGDHPPVSDVMSALHEAVRGREPKRERHSTAPRAATPLLLPPRVPEVAQARHKEQPLWPAIPAILQPVRRVGDSPRPSESRPPAPSVEVG